MIREGDRIPHVKLTMVDDDGTHEVMADELCAGKKVVIFAVPGAFTPTCSERHLPGFIDHAAVLQAKGVDLIACLAVNDAFVLGVWRQTEGAHAIKMLADGGASFTRELGLEMETGDFGGVRARRFAMIIDDGVVTRLLLEAPKAFEVSSAESVLSQL
jgi:peroxiredoxin